MIAFPPATYPAERSLSGPGFSSVEILPATPPQSMVTELRAVPNTPESMADSPESPERV